MVWRIPESDIERVKRSTDLRALVQSRGIELKRHGNKDWIGRCPFHADHDTPNFIVSPEKGLFHCMACGLAGNAIQFVERHDGVSFRHAFELLAQGGRAVFTGAGRASQPGPLKQSTVPRLPCPLEAGADDATLLGQVSAYYHERLKQSASARAYLASRGLDSDELIDRFQLGFADRTLGLRLPHKNRHEGQTLRRRLAQLGLWRQSGHEHFNGCITVPLHACPPHGLLAGQVVSFYGRRVSRPAATGAEARAAPAQHLYAPGPHRGLFNPGGIANAGEVILCEAVFDALTFCAHGFPNATCLFGTEGFTEELWAALKGVRRVRIAYDADDAGERAAGRDAERFRAHGIEVFRVKFPHGMDANQYAGKVQPADKSLALLLNSAQWLGAGARPPAPPPQPTAETNAPAPAPCLAAFVSSLSASAALRRDKPETAAKEEKPPVPTSPTLEQRGDAWFMDIEGREYRVAGLEKTLGLPQGGTLKVALRLRVGDRFHLDQVDLCRDAERRRFIERAAEETGLLPDLLKGDLGRLLLATEQAQAELAKPVEQLAPALTLSPEERAGALAWLREPNLIGRLRRAFHQAGIIGEETNTLVAYLAGVSRKLERPLAMVNPFAPALTFATARTRNRRDHEKYLTLIDVIALLHQHQRQRGQHLVNGRTVEFIEVTLDDIALANQLAPEVLGRSLDELPPQTRRLLGFIRELMKGKRSGSATGHPQKAAKVGAGPACFSRRELRELCGWSLTQVRVHLERLVELEYLAVRHGRLGSQFVYDVLFDLDAPEAVAHVGLLDVAKLSHHYTANLAGFGAGVAGRNGHLAGGGETPPPPVPANVDRALVTT